MAKQEVDERYKVDSTQGASLINPVSYKGDVMVQVWMDSRVLATLCKWLEEKGEYPRFLSHVVRMPLEMLADHFVEKGEAEMVDDTKEARILLEGRFHVSLNKGRKGMKNLMHNITLSSRRGTDLGSRTGGAIDYTRYSSEGEPVEMLSQEEVRAKYFKEQKLKETIEREKEKAKNSGLVVNDDGTPIVEDNRAVEISRLVELDKKLQAAKSVGVKEGMSDEEYEVMRRDREERDRERLELENAPFEVSDLDIVGENGNESE